MKNDADWAVLGAGPAGIAAVGKLLDHGVDPERIAWIDPSFTVGDLGARWQAVSSNTKVKLFKRFLESCESFRFASAPSACSLNHLPESATCLLSEVVKPLQWVSDHLTKRVCAYNKQVAHLRLYDGAWHLDLGDDLCVSATKVILAIGCEPKHLTYTGCEMLTLEQALDAKQLEQCCNKNDTVAVFGSSHSAILALKNLCELPVKKIHNFYLSPLKYAIGLEEDWILFDNTGLKGLAATWAQQNIDGIKPDNLNCHVSNTENVEKYLPHCDKVVYAVGFDRRQLDVSGIDLSNYNCRYGIIAQGLFGLGIAFPEGCADKYDDFEYRVGLWKFMDYLNRVIPVWMHYPY